MSGKYQAYPEYKDSGMEWLDEIPSHWEVMQLKRSVDRCVNGIWGSEPNEDGDDIIVLRVADFERSKLSLKGGGYTYRRIEAKEKAGRLLQCGDLLLEKSGGGQKTLVGQVVLFDKSFEAVTSNFVAKMTPNTGVDSRFLNYVFSRFYEEKINYCSIKQNTGIQNLDSESYLSEKFGFPVKDEQNQIANFLDHETAKIDTLIEKQQQLIRLLKEKRQAVISHAVTKGLNPTSPMRDSGVEWFGELPSHWKVGKLGYYARISNGATPSRENLAYWEGGSVGWLNSSKVNDIHIIEADQFITPLALSQTSVQEVTRHDLVMAITGEGQTRGRVAICFTDAAINQHLASISITDATLNYEFLFYWLSSQYERIRYESSGAGSTKGAITCGDIVSFPLTVPPIEEQLEIIEYISGIEKKLNSLVELAIYQVELLAERRTALISAAVTGKIDVRSWRAPDQNQTSKEIAA